MRVLLIDVNCKDSSTGSIVYDLFQYINSTGNVASVCYGRGKKIGETGIYKVGLDWETYIHAFLTRVTGLTNCFSHLSTRRLIKYIDKYKPDVVNIHELHAYFVNAKKLITYLKKKQIPIVWTFHCEFMYTGKCGVAYECTRFTQGCGKCPHLRQYPQTLFFDFTHHMWEEKKRLLSDYEKLTLVAPSKWLSDRIQLSFLKDKPLEIIHNGIDTNIFHFSPCKEEIKRKYGLSKNKIVLSVASNIMSDPNKGARHILNIAEELVQEDIEFLLVGSDGQAIEHHENVTIVPAIKDKQELARIYSAADVFVICSEAENFPTTCLEAQSCGTPVCGFNVGGVAETVIEGGTLCEYGDLQSLKANILTTIRENKRYADAGETLGREKMLKTYFSLYESILRVGNH